MKLGVNVDSVTTRIFKYYQNGMRFYEQDIFDNEPNGKYRSWYPSGKKFAVGNYINGELFGKWSWYGDDGFLDSVRTYNEDILNGVYIDYFNNGKPQIIIGYLNNKKHGVYKEYDKNGNKISIGEYHKDIPHSKWIWWKDKVKIREINYENGLKNGSMPTYREWKNTTLKNNWGFQ